jgi:hypothetical protein
MGAHNTFFQDRKIAPCLKGKPINLYVLTRRVMTMKSFSKKMQVRSFDEIEEMRFTFAIRGSETLDWKHRARYRLKYLRPSVLKRFNLY